MNNLFIDIETYSSVDLSSAGVYRYTESDDFEILLFGYSLNGEPVKVIDLANGGKLPPDIISMLTDDTCLKWAHNASFERICLSRQLGYPTGKYLNPKAWRCSMVMGLYNGLPRSLKDVGTVLSLDSKKLEEGKDLVRYFCSPCKPTKANGERTRNRPGDDRDKWVTFVEYNRRDVETEMEIICRLLKYNPPDFVWEEYAIDQEINDRGVLIDMRLVDNSLEIDKVVNKKLYDEIKAITGLDNPNSVTQLKGWLSSKGIEAGSLGKKDVEQYSNEYKGTVTGRMMELRKQLSKSSVRKYSAMRNAACSDDRVRGMFMFYGSRTGRWASRLVQLQNLRRNDMADLDSARELVRNRDLEALAALYDDIPDTLSQLVRTALVAPDDSKFVVADFSAIEARVIAWLAKEEWVMDAFREGRDLYCAVAEQMFHVPVVKHGLNGELRQKGKQCTLSCIAENELVLTDKGLVPIQKITKDHKVWDGESWVGHDGLVFRGYREVIEYDGLRATEDHRVYVEGCAEPIPFGIAKEYGAQIIKFRYRESGIRECEDHQSHKALEPEVEPLYGSLPVSEMQNGEMDQLFSPEKAENQGLPALFEASTDTTLAGPSPFRGKKQMRKPGGSGISPIWWKGYKVLLQKCSGGRTLSAQSLQWKTEQELAARPHRHEWQLRSRKSSDGHKRREYCKSKNYCPIGIQTGLLAICKKRGHKKAVKGNDERRDYRGCDKGSGEQNKVLEAHRGKARVYDLLNAGPNHRFTVSNCLVHNCSYGGGASAMVKMGALDAGMKEDELAPLVEQWRAANPHIVQYWKEVDAAIRKTLKTHETVRVGDVSFVHQSGMLFITLPSGRRLSYARPRIGTNRFGGSAIIYEGLDMSKKWTQIESYGPKFVENIVQAVARDLLMNAMRRLRDYRIVAHVHDELIIETPLDTSVSFICEEMAKVPDWASGLLLRADGYETKYYKKD